MNKTDLNSMIDLYFDALLSAAQEEELYRALLACEDADEKQKEALAVMTMARMQYAHVSRVSASPRSVRPVRWRRRRLVAVAAAAVVIAIGTEFIFRTLLSDNTSGFSGDMVAFVGGKKVANPSVIMKIVDTQLNDIGESSEFLDLEIASDLEDIREALNNDGI